MFCLKRSVIILLSISIVVLSQMDDYKPYKLTWEYFTTCNAPKPTSCSIAEIRNTQNMSDLIFVMNVTRNCPVKIAKIVSGTHHENSTKKLINYNIGNPCEHFIFGPILESYVKSAKECLLTKGDYVVHVNMVQNARLFLGAKFFYGRYKFKMMLYNKKDNFLCMETVFNVNKTGEYK